MFRNLRVLILENAVEPRMNPARVALQPQIKAAKNRGLLTANHANHAKEDAAERGFAGLIAGNTAQRFMAGTLMAGT